MNWLKRVQCDGKAEASIRPEIVLHRSMNNNQILQSNEQELLIIFGIDQHRWTDFSQEFLTSINELNFLEMFTLTGGKKWAMSPAYYSAINESKSCEFMRASLYNSAAFIKWIMSQKRVSLYANSRVCFQTKL
mmetsp:Transcript_14349/g.23457  ORF Transcript_14349/g.23457 Transcript_14349/m.23457 type:complete len:133 (+) Transcript_14349:84-482(+)